MDLDLETAWRAAVAAMLLNLDYTRVENKTDAQLRDIVCSNLGKTATSLQTLKV